MNEVDLSGISQEEFQKLQKQLDVDKWLASECAGKDLCGTMDWCKYCLKAEIYPCAKAKFRKNMDAALDEIVDELIEKDKRKKAEESEIAALREIAEDEIAAADLAGAEKCGQTESFEYVVRYRRSFQAKLIQSELLQDLYTEVKNALLAFGGIKTRLCRGGENFRVGKHKIAKLTAGSKKLWLYLALDPASCDKNRYRFDDLSHIKTHRETPLRLKITGRRSLNRAIELLKALAATYKLATVECICTDFHYPYKSDERLLDEGLIKPYTVKVKKKNVYGR